MQISELKKLNVLKTREDSDNIIKAALSASTIGKIIRTSFDDGMYTIEFKAAAGRFNLLGKDSSLALAGAILQLAVTASTYIFVTDESISEIRIMCRVGSDTHITITPCDFLRRLNETGLYKEVIKDWMEVAKYTFVREVGKK